MWDASYIRASPESPEGVLELPSGVDLKKQNYIMN